MEKEYPKNGGKAPSIQFYYKDWLSDSRLRGVSKIIKGVWIDLICLSCDMIIPGVFSNENGPISEENLLELLDGNPRENKAGFSELKNRHIIKQEADGTFYVKRVKLDIAIRNERSLASQEAGRKGGNPNFQKGKPNPYYNPKDNPTHNPKDNLNNEQKDNQRARKEKKKEKKKKRGVVGEKNKSKDNPTLDPPDKGTPEQWAALREKQRKAREH